MASQAKGFKALSKTEQVCSHIEGLLKAGSLKSGDRILPETKLAGRLGVSVVTVKRALEELVLKGVVYKVQGKGTFVAEGAEIEREDAGTANIIYPAAPLAATSDPFLGPLIDGIESVLSKHGRNLRLMPLRDGKTLADLLKDSSSRKALASGSIIVNLQLSLEDCAACSAFGFQAVSVGRQKSCLEMPFVDVDHREGGKAATAHLIAHGRRRIAFLGAKKTGQPYWAEIAEGIKEACQEGGADFDPKLIAHVKEASIGDERSLDAIESALKLLSSGKGFDAAIVFGSETAKAVLDALTERGLSIPKDIAVISYTDFAPVTRSAKPRLSALNQPNEELGAEAARILLKMLRAGPRAAGGQAIILKPDLIERESCGCGRQTKD